MGHLSPVCDSSPMIACPASLRDARRKINFRIAGRNYLQNFKSLRNARQPPDLLKFLAQTLNGMSADEATRAGVENRRAYFRVRNGKANLSPPMDASEWYRLESFDLGNSGDGQPSDSVGVVTRWKWPDAFDGVTVSDLRAVQVAIAAGRWRESSQAKDWAGYAVADVLRLDATNRAHKSKIAALLKTWVASGMLIVVEGASFDRPLIASCQKAVRYAGHWSRNNRLRDHWLGN
jgi:hypothetical protein